MLTEKQKVWINHLSEESIVLIFPFDPSSHQKFVFIKKKIQSHFQADIKVEHHGASSLKISGQDEIDIYIPLKQIDFNNILHSLTELFGKPKSHYNFERARFSTNEEQKKIDIFLVNEESESWSDILRFETYLNNNPRILKEYEVLKENCRGLNTREYYKRKIEFINTVLKK